MNDYGWMTTGRGGDARRGSGRGPGASNRRLRDVDARRFVVTMKERSTTRSERSSWGFTGDGSGRVVADAELFLSSGRIVAPIIHPSRRLSSSWYRRTTVRVRFRLGVLRERRCLGPARRGADGRADRVRGAGRSADASDGVRRVGADGLRPSPHNHEKTTSTFADGRFSVRAELPIGRAGMTNPKATVRPGDASAKRSRAKFGHG